MASLGAPVSQGQPTLAPLFQPTYRAAPPWYAVWFRHDHQTPPVFLAAVLIEIFRQSPEAGAALVQVVEAQGRARLGPYTRDLAETRTLLARQWAQQEGHPLHMTIAPF